MRTFAFACLAMLSWTLPANGQTVDQRPNQPASPTVTPPASTPALATSTMAAPRLTIERLFEDPALNGPTARAARFSPDGKLVTWLRPNDQDFLRLDLWAAPVKGGAAFMLVDSRALVPDEGELSEAEKARRERARLAGSRGLVSYDWDEKGQAILAPLGGDLYYVALANTKAPRRLTQTPQFETDGKISPAGKYVSFVREGALYALDLATGTESRLSPLAQGSITYGMAEFIAQEEMDRDTGYWWAPDDGKVVYAQVDEGQVALVPRVEIGATSTTIIEQRYPRAGAKNAVVSLFIRDLASGSVTAIDLGTNQDIYVARVHWSKDGKSLYVQRQNRAQTRTELLLIEPTTGASRVIASDVDPTWVNLTKDFTPLANGDFLWTTERSGFRHIERRDREGRLKGDLTSGPWPVIAIEGVDEKAGRVFFTSNKDDTLEHRLYAAPLAPTISPRGQASTPIPTPTPITPPGGTWSVDMARGGASFLATYSDPTTPPRFGLFGADGKLKRWIEENRLDDTHPWGPFRASRAKVQFGTLKGPSGVDLNWSMHLPPDFDPTRRWPVITYVYGGPGVQVVQRNWGSNTDQLHAARGYIVFRLDNRGTPNRGHLFERAIARKLGGPEVEDQLAGLAFLKTQSFVDPQRIGVWGWSYGGYMALKLASDAPEAYQAYVAGAPVTDWALYDTHYTERFMGMPINNAAAYEKSSVLPRLKDVKRPLLILHGMADDNVTFDNSTAAFDRLQAASVPFEAMVYPGQKHGIREKARAKHVQATILNFLDRTLGPGPR
jgi:dipeptidyl-peptidase 4